MIYSEDDLRLISGGSVSQATGSNMDIDFVSDLDLSLGSGVAALEVDKAVIQEHPDYKPAAAKWQKYLDLYQSNDVYRFIHKHLRESDEMWKQRVERAFYDNYVASVVDLFASYVFASPISRFVPQSLNQLLNNEVYKDADRSGTTFDSFMRLCTIYGQVEGHVGILVDSPRVPDGLTEAQRQDRKYHPFLTMLHAHQIIDWELDEFGEFEWVKFTIQRPQKRSWREEFDPNKYNVMVWTKQTWEEYEVTGQGERREVRLVGAEMHSLGVVPLVILRFVKDGTHPWFGVSTVRDIADINIHILNASSLGDEEIYERCLNVLCMQMDGESGDSKVEISHHNVLGWSGDKPPFYLTPGATPLDLIMRWIAYWVEEIHRLARIKGPTGIKDVRQAISGIAYAFEFAEINQILCAMASQLEQAETKIHGLLARWDGKSFEGGKIEYPREFGVADPLVDLNTLVLARQALTSETAIKESEKRVIRRNFPKADAKDIQKMEKEVDDNISGGFGVESMFGMGPTSAAKSPKGKVPDEDEEGDGKAEEKSSRPEGNQG